MANVRQLYASLELRAENFNNQMRAAQKEARQFQKDIAPTTTLLKDVGAAATKAGTLLTAGLTLPLTAIAAVSVKAASEFESSFTGVRKTVDATEREFAELSAGIREMAKDIPTSTTELNAIAEAAGQLGIKKEDILQFTKTMSQLGVTTNLTSDQAATAVAQIQNIFGAAGKDVDRFGATLVALGNAGASTEKDIIEMGLRIAGAGNLIGLTQAQVLSFASALSSVGINAEAGGSALSRVFLKINDAVASGSEALDGFARVAGVSTSTFAEAFRTDAAGAVAQFIGGLGRLKGEGENISATLETLVGKNIIIKDTLLRASGAGQLLSDTLKLGNEAWQANTALVSEAEKRYQTFESQWKILRNSINDVAITLGQAFLPILKSLIDTSRPWIERLGEMAKGFETLNPAVKVAIFAVGGLAAAVGPALLLLGTMATGVANLIPLYLRLAPLITGSATATTLFGAAMSALPWVAMTAGITAVILLLGDLVETYRNNKEAAQNFAAATDQSTKNLDKQIAFLKEQGIEIDKTGLSQQKLTERVALATRAYQSWDKSMKDSKGSIVGMTIDLQKGIVAQGKSVKLTEEQVESTKKFRDEVERLKQAVMGDADATKTLVTAIREMERAKIPAEAISKKLAGRIKEEYDNAMLMKQAVDPLIVSYYTMSSAMDKTSRTLEDFAVDMSHATQMVKDGTHFIRQLEVATLSISFDKQLQSIAAFGPLLDQVGESAERTQRIQEIATESVTRKQQEAAAKRKQAEEEAARRTQEVWIHAMGNVTSGLASGLADVLFAGKNFGEAMVNIAKQTARGMFEAFMAGMLSPLTSALGNLGANLGKTLFGGGIGGAGGVGGVATSALGGGLLSKIPGLGGLFGGGAAAAAGGLATAAPELAAMHAAIAEPGLIAGGAGASAAKFSLFGLGTGASIATLGAAIGPLIVKSIFKSSPFAELEGGSNIAMLMRRTNDLEELQAAGIDINQIALQNPDSRAEDLLNAVLTAFRSGQFNNSQTTAPNITNTTNNTNNFQIVEQPGQDTSQIVNEIIRYLQSNSGAAQQFSEALPSLSF